MGVWCRRLLLLVEISIPLDEQCVEEVAWSDPGFECADPGFTKQIQESTNVVRGG